MKKMTDKEIQKACEQYEKAQMRSRRYLVKQSLMYKKAKAAGITVTEKEIDDELNRRK